jgi:hypothetical protein
MIEMQVTRARDDRRRYGLDEQAWWRRESWRSYTSHAVVDGRRLRFSRTGLFGRVATAEDAATGEVVAEWRSRGGRVSANGAELRLRRAGRWKSAWALANDTSELVRLETRGWSGREMRLSVEPDARVSRVVLLFAAWLVACLAQDDSSAVAAAGTAAAASTMNA